MGRMRRPLLAALALVAIPLVGQPRIPPRAIVNAASFARVGLPNGKIARGSIFTVFGEDIGPGNPVVVNEFPLGDVLGEISITVTQGERTVNAIPLFGNRRQVNAIMPSDAPLGRSVLRVLVGQTESNPAPIEVVESSFGIFSANGTGLGPGIVQNFVSPDVQPINSIATVARRGQLVTLWGTGLGPVDFPDNEAPIPETLPIDVEIWVGGVPVPRDAILYAGRSPCCAGVDQIIFPIPEQVPLGCYVPVFLRTEENSLSNMATMAIAEVDGACDKSSQPFLGGGSFGAALAAEVDLQLAVDTPTPTDIELDIFTGTFRSESASPFFFNPLLTSIPAGTCAVVSGSGDFIGGAEIPMTRPSGALLSGAERFTIGGPSGIRQVSRQPSGPLDYFGILGASLPDLPLATPFFGTGEHILTAAAGTDLGAIRATFDLASAPTWINRDEIGVVDRASDLQIEFGGLHFVDSLIGVGGFNYDKANDSATAFYCLTSAGEGAATVPEWILSALPASSANPGQSVGVIGLWSQQAPAMFEAEGLDRAAILALPVVAKTVIFE